MRNEIQIQKQIQTSWSNFKVFNIDSINEDDFKLGFQFIMLYCIFKKLTFYNVNLYSKECNLLEEISLINHFSEQLCYERCICTIQENCLKIRISYIEEDENKQVTLVIPEKVLLNTERDFNNILFLEEKENFSFIYSATLDIETKKTKGSFYTPPPLADLLTSKSIDLYLDNNSLLEITILDNSCGTGNFILSSFRHLFQKFSKLKESNNVKSIITLIVKNHLIGYDTDLFALVICKLRLLYEFYKICADFDYKKENLNELFSNLKYQDYLVNYSDSKPSILIGNPPWGGYIGVEYKKKVIKTFNFQQGQIDRYRLFLEAALKTYPQIITLLTPDTWFEIPGAKLLRKYFFLNWDIHSSYIIPDSSFIVKTHFLGFTASRKQKNINVDQNISIIKLDDSFNVESTVIRKLRFNYLNSLSFLQVLLLDMNLQDFLHFLETDSTIIKLDSLIDCTIGYQLYHHSIHSKDEIQGKVYHSNTKIDDNWIQEINSKDLKLLEIDLSHKHYVKKNANYFRIPQSKFFTSNKLLLREVVSKNGFVISLVDKPVFFTKTIISLILKEKTNDKTLLIILGYLLSYVSLFDFYVNGIKGSKKFFPRVSINSLKQLNFSTNLYTSGIEFTVEKLLNIKKDSGSVKEFSKYYQELQAKVFLSYYMDSHLSELIMNFLKIPSSQKEEVLEVMNTIKGNKVL